MTPLIWGERGWTVTHAVPHLGKDRNTSDFDALSTASRKHQNHPGCFSKMMLGLCPNTLTH